MATAVPADGVGADAFGSSVALGREWLAVGAPLRDDGATDAGAVYMFRRDGQGWRQDAKLQAGDLAPHDGFGRSVAMDGQTLVIGACNDDDGAPDAGSAYVYQWDGGAWRYQAKLLAGDPSKSANFGCSVAISGQTIVVGAYSSLQAGKYAGAAYVFGLAGGTWSQSARLVAPDPVTGDNFGCSVSIDDDRLAVGAYGRDEGGVNAGACYVFDRSGQTWTPSAKLLAADATGGAKLGSAVALSGGLVAVTGTRDGGGAAYVFALGDAGWSQQAKLSSPTPAEGDGFGASVTFDGPDLVVGAPGDASTGAAGAGAVYVFGRQGAAWLQPTRLTASAFAGEARLGESLAARDGCIVAGSPGAGTFEDRPGSVLTFADGKRTAWQTDLASPPGLARWDDPGRWTAGQPGLATDATVEGGPVAEVAAGVTAVAGKCQIGLAAAGSLTVRGDGTLDVAGLCLGSDGSLLAEAGGTIRLRGNLDIRVTDLSRLDLAAATVRFALPDAPGPNLLEAVAVDAGPDPAAWVGSFAIGTLLVESGVTVRLVDAVDNDPAGPAPQAVYVGELVLQAGAAIDLNGLALYYRSGGAPRRLIAGDTDLDGDVDGMDMLAVTRNYGVCGSPGWAGGDCNGDGTVDWRDYLAMKQAFGLAGQSAGSPPPQTPEPTCLALLAVAAACGVLRRPGRGPRTP